MVDQVELVELVATRLQLWWMTQKHQPMHQNDAADLARAAIGAIAAWSPRTPTTPERSDG